jgi:ribonuclease HII
MMRAMAPRRVLCTLGIDEAGRGPAIGPMVMAAVSLTTKAAAKLSRAGLTDSKAFGAGPDAHARRLELAVVIRQEATFVDAEVAPASTIDERVARGELNQLEREMAIRLIEKAPTPDRMFADGARMFAPLCARFPTMVALDRAESRHAAVAAASVIAKTLRDELFAAICARYASEFGPIGGGGYVNDRTRKFLRAYCERYRRLPDEARRSWPHPYVVDLIGDTRTPPPQMSLL